MGQGAEDLEMQWADGSPESPLPPRRKRCDDCGKNWADRPSKLCPGCEAYREHTGAI